MIKELAYAARAFPLLVLLMGTPAVAQVTNGLTPGENQTYTGPGAPYDAPKKPGQDRTYQGSPRPYVPTKPGYNRQYTDPTEPYVDPNGGNPGSGFTPGQGVTVPGSAAPYTTPGGTSQEKDYVGPTKPNTGVRGAGHDQVIGGPAKGSPLDHDTRHYRNNHHF